MKETVKNRKSIQRSLSLANKAFYAAYSRLQEIAASTPTIVIENRARNVLDDLLHDDTVVSCITDKYIYTGIL